MIHLTGGILLILEYGLAVFCFVEIVRSPEAAVPWIPRWGWIVAVLIFPLAASIGWLVAGHHGRLRVRSGTPVAVDGETSLEQTASAVPQTRTGRFGSLEDDAALLAQLWDVNEEHERTLRRWEEDLCRREEALRQRLGREQTTRSRLSDAA